MCGPALVDPTKKLVKNCGRDSAWAARQEEWRRLFGLINIDDKVGHRKEIRVRATDPVLHLNILP